MIKALEGPVCLRPSVSLAATTATTLRPSSFTPSTAPWSTRQPITACLQAESRHHFPLGQNFPGCSLILLGEFLKNLFGFTGVLPGFGAALHFFLRSQPPPAMDLGVARRQCVLANLAEHVIIFMNIDDAVQQPGQYVLIFDSPALRSFL